MERLYSISSKVSPVNRKEACGNRVKVYEWFRSLR
nr:MAG TPA: hypothetical protein [Bacteriophage sp.]